MAESAHDGASPESSVATTATLTGTSASLGGQILDGVAVRLVMTGGVVSKTAAGGRRNARDTPATRPCPAIWPLELTAVAPERTHSEPAGMRPVRSRMPLASLRTDACES